jgi:hypothetical protein
MKKLILIRFGDRPNPTVSNALKPHIVGQAFAGPVPGAIMSVFNTESDEAQITQDLKETGAIFFLMNADLVNLNLPEGMMEAINGMLGIQTKRETPVLTVDEILEKISAKGIASLTPAEIAKLEAGE